MDNFIIRLCECCGNDMYLKINKQKGTKTYGQIIKIHQTKRFCSVNCLNKWQSEVSWEDRVGKETAKKIRKNMSKRARGDNNPTKNKEIAKKVSESLKQYLKENPRLGEKNPFYGKHHTEEYKKQHSENKKGKRSYNEEGYKKQKENTPKGENHPNWLGGVSNSPYPFEFNNKLKKEIKERDNYNCNICNKKTQKLAIHHIDYDKSNIDRSNLISLCYKCHPITNYNRDKWKIFLNEKINEKIKN